MAQVGVGDDDDSTKEKLLEAMGFGIEQTPKEVLEHQQDASLMDMLLQLDSCYSRITRDCSTLPDGQLEKAEMKS